MVHINDPEFDVLSVFWALAGWACCSADFFGSYSILFWCLYQKQLFYGLSSIWLCSSSVSLLSQPFGTARFSASCLKNAKSKQQWSNHALQTSLDDELLPNLFVSCRRKCSFAFWVSFLVWCSFKQFSRRPSCLASNSFAGGMTTDAIFCSKIACRFSANFFKNCGTAFSSFRCSLRIRRVLVFAYPKLPGSKCLSKRSASPGYSMASMTL